jgi:hypothetical protein
MGWGDKDTLVGAALYSVRAKLIREGKEPTGQTIVLHTLRDAMDIRSRAPGWEIGKDFPIVGGPAQLKAFWPDYRHTIEERIAAYDHAVEHNEVYRPLAPTEFQIETAVAIYAVFRRHLTGREKSRLRDWTILQYRALGREHKEIAERLGMNTKQAVSLRVEQQCGEIWNGVEPLLLEAEQRLMRRAAA